MIYETTQPSVLVTLIGLIILWHFYRKEKRLKEKRKAEEMRKAEKRKAEEKRKSDMMRHNAEEYRKKREELDRERSRIRESGMIPEAVFLTENEIKKKRFCEKMCGETDIAKEVIFLAWKALNDTEKEERQSLVNRFGERKGRKETVMISMDKEDLERIKYCQIITTMDESSIYVLGLELYEKQISK
ncbi:MAG: hypothetical protein LIO76_01740 [Clostridiales bacterium]|nr:hypothetical protein [Clostridiales bacterium]